ncbi:putative ATP-dependent permease [Clavispora lusitaniae]|uniref:ATP-dependent permease n=1 Tax=Clavispora lusitaniae TaxID=36911 RepID=A0ACD0WLG8_CLALS|nr:putative ATP-dependent permease [Clavispora lusitaniae]QFZ34076.1 putative ATP-dependent permease [Clavispora lusitaniae]QFZ39760.1 putative ATP-dependent permease [Clavispora lusitaniae]QFZ45442.1 putative ATP-dependent permease [Clavispora lusitaniae]QFZ51106.1 putative ATP-dependent permease [Clavispora lusitaniae]
MAGLSSNVMNMKFMQRAQTKKNEKKNEDAIRKVKDSSEWVLPNKTSLQAKTKPAVQVQTVGYGSIATLMTKKEEIKEDGKSNDEVSNESIKDPKKEAEVFLQSIMSETKKRSKKQEGNKKKKKQKKN